MHPERDDVRYSHSRTILTESNAFTQTIYLTFERSLSVRGGVDVDGSAVTVHIRDGLIVEAVPEGAPVLDASGLTVGPGLIDLQVNGACGIDITAEPRRLWDVAAALPRFGVTAFTPTVITSSHAAREQALAALAAGPEEGWSGAVPLGLHMEGPMLAPARKGVANGVMTMVPRKTNGKERLALSLLGLKAEAEGGLGITALVAIAALFFTAKWLGFA